MNLPNRFRDILGAGLIRMGGYRLTDITLKEYPLLAQNRLGTPNFVVFQK